MFGQAKPLASLSGGLLARKGAARPAMRPQGFATVQPTSQQLDDLGWNDMGVEAPPVPEAEKPPVLVAREALAEVIETEVERGVESKAESITAVRPVSVATATRLSRETAHAGRAAFTLRLGAEPHLKLRLASALANRSAQQIVAEALDQYLATVPQVDALVAQLPPQKLSHSRGKRR